MQANEQQTTLAEVLAKLAVAEKQVDGCKILPAKDALSTLKDKYGV